MEEKKLSNIFIITFIYSRFSDGTVKIIFADGKEEIIKNEEIKVTKANSITKVYKSLSLI